MSNDIHNSTNRSRQLHVLRGKAKRFCLNRKTESDPAISWQFITTYFLGISVLLLSLLLAGCSEEKASSEFHGKPHITVRAVQIEPRSFIATIQCFGVLEAANEVNLNVDFSAPVAEVLVDEGQRVHKGQVLLRFDTEKLRLNYKQTKSALAQTKANLENHSLTQARIQALLKKKTVSQQVADDARFDYEAARAKVEEMKSSLQLIKRDLDNSEVLSPIDAVVSGKMIEAGQNATAFQPLLLLEAVESIKVSVYVGEKVVSQLRVGDPARINSVAGSFDSAIYSVGAKSDPQTGNFEIKLLLDNSDRHLKPGMTADVQLTTQPLNERLVIPEGSLVGNEGQYVVYQIIEGKAVRTAVEVNLEYDDQLIVTSGLRGGETLIVAGAEKVSHGAKVEVAHE